MVVSVGMTGLNFDSRNVELVNSIISIPVFHIADGVITYCNPSFRRLFKLSTQHHQPFSLDQFFNHEETFLHLLAQCTPENPLFNVMVQCRTQDCHSFWATLNLAKSEDANGSYYFGTLDDQTEIIEREKLLRQRNEDLKKLNSQLDRFIYSTSHDIRQPIASIMGLIHLMQMESKGNNPHDYLSKIETSVVKLDEFLTKILQFSKNSHEQIGSQHLDVNSFVTQQLSAFQTIARQSNISTLIEISDDFVFYSDSDRLGVALHHILKNCFEYFDRMKTDCYVKVLITTYADRCIIEVIDNGIGISKAHIDKVTGMFYRATERSKGSGLGLYIVNEIVLKLKGTILIDSEVGLGTMVRLEIPNGVKGQLVNRKRLLTKNPGEGK